MDAKGRRLTVKAKQMEERDLESVIERAQDRDAGRWGQAGWLATGRSPLRAPC